MNIEIGKCYQITPKWKKSVEEIEYFTNRDGTKTVACSILWRGGTFRVTPQNEDEVEMLKEHLEDDSMVFEPYSFEEFEFLDTWDGCSEDLEFFSNGADTDIWTDEEIEEIETEREEEFLSTVLENRDFNSTDCEIFIHNGIEAEEVVMDIY